MSKKLENNAIHNRFRTFFEQSILPMEIYDLEGNPLEVNQAWVNLFQTTREELKGYNLLTDPSSKKLGMLPYIEKALAGEPTEMPAFYLDPKDLGKVGSGRWLEAWFSPVKDENDKVIELAIILKDITEHKKSEEEIERLIFERKFAEERLSLAVKVGEVGVWEWKPGDKKVYWDETMEAHYGYAPGTFSGLLEDYSSAIHPDDVQEMWAIVNEAQSNKKPYIMDHRIIRKNGEVRWLQGSGTTFYDKEGNPVRMMGTAIDITDKKNTILDQKFISEVSDILSSSFDFVENLQKVGELVSHYFCDGCFVDLLLPDGEVKRIVVAAGDEEIKEKLLNLQLKYSHDHPLFNVLITGKSLFIDFSHVSNELEGKSGQEYFSELASMNLVSSLSIRLKGWESLLGAITFFNYKGGRHQFIDRHRWLSQEIAYRASNAIENSLLYINSQEAIKSRDEFLSIASHELKTPLTSLTLQNQMRKRMLDKDNSELVDKAKVRKMVEADERQFRRINRLVDDMLDITRILSDRLEINKENFEFNSFIEEIIERHKPQFEAAGCDFTLKLCEPITFEADSHRLEQVVVNLITNAMKYGAGKPVKIETVKSKNKVSLLVQDNGSGIDEKDTERIFQRFERAVHAKDISGLGLGLYISRQIVEQHDGTIFVRSEKGQGSTFVMELPL